MVSPETSPDHILSLGPSSKMDLDKKNLLEELGVGQTPRRTLQELVMVVVLELLILLSFALRITFVFSMAPFDLPPLASYWDIFTEREEPSYFKLRHSLTAAFVWMLLLPQLFVASLCRNTDLNQLVKLVLSVVVLVITTISLCLETLPQTDCAERGSCGHKAVSVPLIVMTFLFLVTTLVRLVIRTRVGKYLTKVRIFGAVLEELSSEGSQRIQYLLLAVLLTLSLSSGSKLAFQQTFSDFSFQENLKGFETFAVESILDSSSVLCTTAWLLLFLWLHAQVHHRRNGQNVVRRNILEEELQALAEYHKETLLAESNVSTIRYRPITMNGQIPLTSSCRRDGRDMKKTGK